MRCYIVDADIFAAFVYECCHFRSISTFFIIILRCSLIDAADASARMIRCLRHMRAIMLCLMLMRASDTLSRHMMQP